MKDRPFSEERAPRQKIGGECRRGGRVATIGTQIDINAPAERILRVCIQPPGRAAMTFKPKVLTATRAREWRGRLIVPGLFDGEHAFRIEDRGRTCRLHHSERFSGVLAPLFGAGLLDATRHGFEAMNAALKSRVEGTTGA
jgi:hypothetical protein